MSTAAGRSIVVRVTGDRPVLLDLLFYLLVAASPTLIFWVALRLLPAACASFDEWRRVRRRSRRPAGPPLESVVANLRRLRREVRGRPQSNRVRQLALITAYDDTLVEVCGCIGVEAPLATAVGAERAFARLITEAALEEAGIALDPPGSGTAAA